MNAPRGPNSLRYIAAGDGYTCTIESPPGPVTCWGDNRRGQLGDGRLVSRHDKAEVVDITNAVDLAGGAYHVCAVLADGTLRCWGDNSSGQLGDRTSFTQRAEPVAPYYLD